MNSFRRLIVVALLVVFTVGSLAHSANASFMVGKMADANVMSVAMGSAPMDGCDECDREGATPVCDNVCITPLLAVFATTEIEHSIDRPETFLDADVRPVAHIGSPDPTPPRTISLT